MGLAGEKEDDVEEAEVAKLARAGLELVHGEEVAALGSEDELEDCGVVAELVAPVGVGGERELFEPAEELFEFFVHWISENLT